MKKFTYKGSTKESHGKIIALGVAFGCQHIRKSSIGEHIAKLANEGNVKAIEVCKLYKEFFTEE